MSLVNQQACCSSRVCSHLLSQMSKEATTDLCSKMLLSSSWVHEVRCLCCAFISSSLIPAASSFQSHGHRERSGQTSPPGQHLLSSSPPWLSMFLFPLLHMPLPLLHLPLGGRRCTLLGRLCQRSIWKDLIRLIPLNLSTPAFSFPVRRQPAGHVSGSCEMLGFFSHVGCCFLLSLWSHQGTKVKSYLTG